MAEYSQQGGRGAQTLPDGKLRPDQQASVGGNTTTLLRPVDEIIAYSQVDLHRSNFMDEDMAAVVEGSSHDLIMDAMRWAASTDTASIHGVVSILSARNILEGIPL